MLLIALFILTLTACKKNNSDPTPDTVGMSFKFNGTTQKYNNVLATFFRSENSVQVIGSDGTRIVSFAIKAPKTGTFDLLSNETVATYSSTSDINNTYISTNGKLVITKFSSDTMAGTFEFSGLNGMTNQTATITEGTFTAKLINQ